MKQFYLSTKDLLFIFIYLGKMDLLILFLFINLFNYFPQIFSNENILEVQIRRAVNNPEYGSLYSTHPNVSPRMKLELHRLHDWDDKKENPVWMGQIEENNQKFDKFIVAKLPNEWIRGLNLNLDQEEILQNSGEILLELRIEMIETREVNG